MRMRSNFQLEFLKNDGSSNYLYQDTREPDNLESFHYYRRDNEYQTWQRIYSHSHNQYRVYWDHEALTGINPIFMGDIPVNTATREWGATYGRAGHTLTVTDVNTHAGTVTTDGNWGYDPYVNEADLRRRYEAAQMERLQARTEIRRREAQREAEVLRLEEERRNQRPWNRFRNFLTNR